MNVHFPDVGTIRTVLALTSRAPSVHNTQPWRWLVGGQSLHLYSDPDRQLPNIDPDGRDRPGSGVRYVDNLTVWRKGDPLGNRAAGFLTLWVNTGQFDIAEELERRQLVLKKRVGRGAGYP